VHAELKHQDKIKPKKQDNTLHSTGSIGSGAALLASDAIK